MTKDEIEAALEWIKAMNKVHAPHMPGGVVPVYETLIKLCELSLEKRKS